MKKLLAACLAQKMHSTPVSGQYDPEQELWIADNQMSCHTINDTSTHSNTKEQTSHLTARWIPDIGWEADLIPDDEGDSDGDTDQAWDT